MKNSRFYSVMIFSAIVGSLLIPITAPIIAYREALQKNGPLRQIIGILSGFIIIYVFLGGVPRFVSSLFPELVPFVRHPNQMIEILIGLIFYISLYFVLTHVGCRISDFNVE